MEKSAKIIPFPFRAFAPRGELDEQAESLGRQRTLSDAISAIQVHRDCLDGLRLPLLALYEGWEAGRPLRTLQHLMERGPASLDQEVLGQGFRGKANPLPDPEAGTGDVLTLGSDILPEELECSPAGVLTFRDRGLVFPFTSVQAYIEALDEVLLPDGIRVVPANAQRLPGAWRGLRQADTVPLFISLGGLAELPGAVSLPGFVENAPSLTMGYRQWPSLLRYAPGALPILAAESYRRLRLLDGELAQRLDSLAEVALAAAQAPHSMATPEACAQSLAAALRASAARDGKIGHAPLDRGVTEKLLED